MHEELTLEEFLVFLKKNPFLEQVTLTGGEPFLRSDLSDMFLALDKRGQDTGTTTNALALELIKKQITDTLRGLSGKNTFSLQISVDGLEEMHDYIRGVKGNFKKAMALLSWCRELEKECSFFDLPE
jgi:MoaA/NifB/PqqE/SkfB family radical SAM enzyme